MPRKVLELSVPSEHVDINTVRSTRKHRNDDDSKGNSAAGAKVARTSQTQTTPAFELSEPTVISTSESYTKLKKPKKKKIRNVLGPEDDCEMGGPALDSPHADSVGLFSPLDTTKRAEDKGVASNLDTSMDSPAPGDIGDSLVPPESAPTRKKLKRARKTGAPTGHLEVTTPDSTAGDVPTAENVTFNTGKRKKRITRANMTTPSDPLDNQPEIAVLNSDDSEQIVRPSKLAKNAPQQIQIAEKKPQNKNQMKRKREKARDAPIKDTPGSHSRSASAMPSSQSRPVPLPSRSTSAVSSRPPAHPPLPDSDADVENDKLATKSYSTATADNKTLAEMYRGIPEEFAPCLPKYDPLPKPLRDVQRRNPFPQQDVDKLSAAELRLYQKKLKFEIKDLTENDAQIVGSALSRLEALLNTINCFPNGADLFHFMLVANAWACRKHNAGNLLLEEGSPYEELLLARSALMKTKIVNAAVMKVPLHYGLKLGGNPENIAFNKNLVARQMTDANFTCPSDDLGGLYENPIFEMILKQAFFLKINSPGVAHRDLWETVTIPALAAVASVTEKSFIEHKAGESIKINFSKETFSGIYLAHIASLCAIYRHPLGQRLAEHLKGMGARLLEPYSKVWAMSATEVAPRIPISLIESRYGRPPPNPAPSKPSRVEDTKPPSPPHHESESSSESELGLESESGPMSQLNANTEANLATEASFSSSSSEDESGLEAASPADIANPAEWARVIREPGTSRDRFDMSGKLAASDEDEESDSEGYCGTDTSVLDDDA